MNQYTIDWEILDDVFKIVGHQSYHDEDEKDYFCRVCCYERLPDKAWIESMITLLLRDTIECEYINDMKGGDANCRSDSGSGVGYREQR